MCLSIPTGMQPRKLTFGLNWCRGKAPKGLFSVTCWMVQSCLLHQPCSSCPGKKKDARISTVSAVWCWTINPGKWADNGSFWLLLWLTRVTVADSSCLPQMNLLKYSDSATITQTLKLANMVRLRSAEQIWASKNCFLLCFGHKRRLFDGHLCLISLI